MLVSAAAVLAVVVGLTPLALSTSVARAAPAPTATAATTWSVTNATVWGMGDSLFAQCGETLGLPDRSLGIVGWWGATTQDVRDRMSSPQPDWPYMTEASHVDEQSDLRSAGALIIGLGTNDVRESVTASRFQSNVDWFLQQAAGRPVLWFNIYYPAYAAQAAQLNAVLARAATRHANLRILDWNGFAGTHLSALQADRLHVGSYRAGCQEGRFRLIQASIPVVAGQPTPDYTTPPAGLPSPNPITAKYTATGGAGGPLGAVSGAPTCGLRSAGCRQAYTNGLVYWSANTGAHALTNTTIRTKWLVSDAEMGILGYPVSDTACGLPGGGCSQQFQAATVYWSPSTGARLSSPVLDGRYRALGGPSGALGYPTGDSDVVCSRGCIQHFQGGSIYWSPTGGSKVVYGAIYSLWAATGRHAGGLGLPTSDPFCGLRNGGCGQHFQGGSIYYSPATGAQITWGLLRDRWIHQGSEAGPLGYPTVSVFCGLVNGGCAQHFQNGSIYYSATGGAQILRGRIRDLYARLGWERSALGYPVAAETCGLAGGGCSQQFQGGSIYWSAATGAQVVKGAIRDRYVMAGAASSALGYPVTSEFCGLIGGGCANHFQRGSIYYSPATGAHVVRGPIRDRWAQLGWERSSLGYAVTSEFCGLVGGGCASHFQGGSIYYSPTTGARVLKGAIRDAYSRMGWERSSLGYPTSGEYRVPGGVAQRFQKGVLTYSYTTGRVR